jgi:hypothetical protein
MTDLPRSPVLNNAAPAPVRKQEESGPFHILQAEGCPICLRISTWDEKYLFCFLHENYSFPETLEHLTRSLGFCFFHGAKSALDPSGLSSLTFVHNVLAHRVGTIIPGNYRDVRPGKDPSTPLAPPTPAPHARTVTMPQRGRCLPWSRRSSRRSPISSPHAIPLLSPFPDPRFPAIAAVDSRNPSSLRNGSIVRHGCIIPGKRQDRGRWAHQRNR